MGLVRMSGKLLPLGPHRDPHSCLSRLSCPELKRIGEQVKDMGLDAEDSVDETLRRVAVVVEHTPEQPPVVDSSTEGLLKSFDERLAAIQAGLSTLIQRRAVKEYYSTEEVAKLVDRDPYTVREWCRYGRLRAVKRNCGRGKSPEWSIPHEELMRCQNEGLRALRQ
jgi:Helix-turn-helix domain